VLSLLFRSRFTDSNGNTGFAVATIDPTTNTVYSGLIHENGELVHFQRASTLADTIGSFRAQTLTEASLAAAGSGLAVHRVSDMKLFGDDGEPLLKCGTLTPPQSNPNAPAYSADDDVSSDSGSATAGSVSEADVGAAAMALKNKLLRSLVTAAASESAGGDSGDNDGKIDYHVPHVPFASTLSNSDSDNGASDENSGNRKLLLKKWTNCFSGGPYKLRSLLAVDVGTYAALGSTTSAVSTAMSAMYALVNTVYYPQLDLYVTIDTLLVRTTTGTEAWNHLAKTTSGTTCPSSVSTLLDQFTAWKNANYLNDFGFAHLMTSCFPPPGTVGLAYVGTIGSKSYSTGWSQQMGGTTWLTFAHEVGHNLGAQHTFSQGQGTTGTSLRFKLKEQGTNINATSTIFFNCMFMTLTFYF